MGGPETGLVGPGGGPRGYGGRAQPAPRSDGEVAERPKAHAWKACIRQRIVGSNPTLSARESCWSLMRMGSRRGG